MAHHIAISKPESETQLSTRFNTLKNTVPRRTKTLKVVSRPLRFFNQRNRLLFVAIFSSFFNFMKFSCHFFLFRQKGRSVQTVGLEVKGGSS